MTATGTAASGELRGRGLRGPGVGEVRARRGCAVWRRGSGQGGSTDRRRGLPLAARLAEDGVQPPKGSSRLEERDEMLEGNPVGRQPGDRRAALGRGSGRYAEPARDSELLSDRRSAETGVRPADSLVAGASSLPAARHGNGSRGSCCGSSRMAGRMAASTPGCSSRIERILADPNFFFRVERDPANVAAGTAVPPLGPRDLRRGCRSFCGAACPTRSCSTWLSADV